MTIATFARPITAGVAAVILGLGAAACGRAAPPYASDPSASEAQSVAQAGSSSMSMGGPSTAMSSDQMDAVMKASMATFPAKTAGTGGQPLVPTLLADGTKQFDLTAEVVQWEVSPGKLVAAWTYNGVVPGPTLRANVGDKVAVVLHNKLPESTSIHFHGIQTPNDMDGTPFVGGNLPVKPGQDFTYRFTATQVAVGMYHSHDDAVKQVPNGMVGAFYIGDMPVPAGVTVTGGNQPFVLDDAGTIGLSINGKSFPATAPFVAKVGQWIEVTYYNEGLMAHPMHLHEFPQLVIAKDGYPLTTPYSEDVVTVAPGERWTVLVHVNIPGVWVWHCHILTHAENDQGMFGMVTALVAQ